SGNGQGTVTSAPAGISCSTGGGGSCNASFAEGASVTLTATPNDGSSFAGFTGCPGGGNSCTLTLSADQSVTAQFNSGSGSGYVRPVDPPGDGVGTVTSRPPGINCTTGWSGGCSHDFGPSVGSVALTATPSASSTFAGWSFGGCSGSGYTTTCSVG